MGRWVRQICADSIGRWRLLPPLHWRHNRPPIPPLSSRQTNNKATKLRQRSSYSGSGPGPGGLLVPGELVSWLLRRDHTGGFRAAPLAPVAGSGTGGVGASRAGAKSVVVRAPN